MDRAACEVHGQCVAVAPALFSFDAEDNLVHVAEVSADQARGARDAMSFCPAQAIRVVD